MVFRVVGDHHDHFVAAVQHGVAAWHDHSVLTQDRHDRRVARQAEIVDLLATRR